MFTESSTEIGRNIGAVGSRVYEVGFVELAGPERDSKFEDWSKTQRTEKKVNEVLVRSLNAVSESLEKQSKLALTAAAHIHNHLEEAIQITADADQAHRVRFFRFLFAFSAHCRAANACAKLLDQGQCR
jgi:hypothetical protein